MFQIPLATSCTTISKEKFWDTIILYHNRPHLVNRKLTAVSQCLFYEVSFNSNGVHLQDLLNRPAILYELRKLDSIITDNVNDKFLKNLLDPYDKNVQFNSLSVEALRDYTKGVFMSVRILFPRMRNCPKAIEVVTFDKEHNKATFLAVSDSDKLFIGPPFAYQIELTSSLNLRINVKSFEDADTSHAEWLVEKLFTKLLKWIENVDDNKQNIQSLSLVPVDEYCLTYNRLKDTYGESLVKVIICSFFSFYIYHQLL